MAIFLLLIFLCLRMSVLSQGIQISRNFLYKLHLYSKNLYFQVPAMTFICTVLSESEVGIIDFGFFLVPN
jgi:hypothetical protein